MPEKVWCTGIAEYCKKRNEHSTHIGVEMRDGGFVLLESLREPIDPGVPPHVFFVAMLDDSVNAGLLEIHPTKSDFVTWGKKANGG